MSKRNPTYYEGDLPRALLDAAKVAIEERGLDAVTLRSLARTVGVSHAAPGHHFGSRAGLFTQLAIEGFRALRTSMLDEMADVPASDPVARTAAAGRGYVRFCSAEPGLFAVMFQFGQLDWSDAELVEASTIAYQVLVDTVTTLSREQGLSAPDDATAIIEAWSMVHGLAVLWHSGPLEALHPDTSLDELGARVADAFARQLLP